MVICCSSARYVVFGAHSVSRARRDGAKRIAIEQVVTHPSYSSDTFRYDMALVKLSEPVTFSDKVSLWAKLGGKGYKMSGKGLI